MRTGGLYGFTLVSDQRSRVQIRHSVNNIGGVVRNHSTRPVQEAPRSASSLQPREGFVLLQVASHVKSMCDDAQLECFSHQVQVFSKVRTGGVNSSARNTTSFL